MQGYLISGMYDRSQKDKINMRMREENMHEGVAKTSVDRDTLKRVS
jgi:hypothetical protein